MLDAKTNHLTKAVRTRLWAGERTLDRRMSRWSKTARASCWDSNHRTILTTRKFGQSGVDRAVLGRRFYAPDRGHHQGALRHPERQVWLAELPLILAILVAIRRAADRFRCSQEALRKCRWWFCRCTVLTQHRSLLPSCFQQGRSMSKRIIKPQLNRYR